MHSFNRCKAQFLRLVWSYIIGVSSHAEVKVEYDYQMALGIDHELYRKSDETHCAITIKNKWITARFQKFYFSCGTFNRFRRSVGVRGTLSVAFTFYSITTVSKFLFPKVCHDTLGSMIT